MISRCPFYSLKLFHSITFPIICLMLLISFCWSVVLILRGDWLNKVQHVVDVLGQTELGWCLFSEFAWVLGA